jgi:hypothetical protein
MYIHFESIKAERKLVWLATIVRGQLQWLQHQNTQHCQLGSPSVIQPRTMIYTTRWHRQLSGARYRFVARIRTIGTAQNITWAYFKGFLTHEWYESGPHYCNSGNQINITSIQGHCTLGQWPCSNLGNKIIFLHLIVSFLPMVKALNKHSRKFLIILINFLCFAKIYMTMKNITGE